MTKNARMNELIDEQAERAAQAKRERDELQRTNAELAAALDYLGHSVVCMPGRCHCVKGKVAGILRQHDAQLENEASQRVADWTLGILLGKTDLRPSPEWAAALEAHDAALVNPLVEAALKTEPHIRHERWCNRNRDSDGRCECGMWEARAAMDVALAPYRDAAGKGQK
jgi:hypothetical protein